MAGTGRDMRMSAFSKQLDCASAAIRQGSTGRDVDLEKIEALLRLDQRRSEKRGRIPFRVPKRYQQGSQDRQQPERSGSHCGAREDSDR